MYKMEILKIVLQHSTWVKTVQDTASLSFSGHCVLQLLNSDCDIQVVWLVSTVNLNPELRLEWLHRPTRVPGEQLHHSNDSPFVLQMLRLPPAPHTQTNTHTHPRHDITHLPVCSVKQLMLHQDQSWWKMDVQKREGGGKRGWTGSCTRGREWGALWITRLFSYFLLLTALN